MVNNSPIFDTWNILAAIVVASLVLSMLSNWLRGRAYSMKIAAEALKDHFEAVEAIIDDPGLPARFVSFVAEFSESVSDQKSAQTLVEMMIKAPREKKRDRSYSDEFDNLMKTRPDLVEGIQKVVAKGLLAMLFRLSPNKKQIDDFLACLATDPKREMQVASRYVARKHERPDNMVAA